MFQLVFCTGMFLGVCGDIHTFDYRSYEVCAAERDILLKGDVDHNIHFAICKEKKTATPKHDGGE